MASTSCLFLVLAAGEGTRMRSDTPKVMHPIAGEPMLGHVLSAAQAADPGAHLAVVVGPGAEMVEAFVGERVPEAPCFVQTERKGTAHAVLAARDVLNGHAGHVVVLYGDTPLIAPGTITRLLAALDQGADLAVLGFEADDPAGYGRLITEDERLVAIREDADASEAERAIRFCNSGVMAFRGGLLPALLEEIGNENAKGEFYLTDAVAVANARGLAATAVSGKGEEVLGVNSRAQLAEAESLLQDRLRAAVLADGATLIAPQTVFLSHDTKIGRDVTVEPNVFFGPNATVGDGATIRAFCHIEGASIAAGATVGPFARLRPGAELGEGTRVGNFVEVKAAVIEQGAKVNHLTYIGDARVGRGANIGAGTITCNYDGATKQRTDIGAGAFIGSNSALVAPVTIGDGAYVGSGSVITKNVPAGALAIGRARQVEKPGWVANLKASSDPARGKPDRNDQ